jgi:hypothetical protein
MTKSYVPRPDVDVVIDDLAHLFDSWLIDPQLVSEAREFLSHYKIDCFRLVVGGRSTSAAHEVVAVSPRFEPSNLFLRLVAAVRANSLDDLRSVIRGHIPTSDD